MKKKKGFTLIEMILVIALIVILTTVATSSLASYIKNARTVSSGAESHQNKYTVAKTAVDALANKAPVPVKENVSFNPDGGSPVGDIEATVGSIISAPPAPTKTGVSFVGWCSDAGCSIPWNFSTDTVEGAMTLYAQWGIVSPTSKLITYNSMGGSPVSQVPGTVGATISPPSTPTNSGSTFTGWYKESTCANQWNFSSDPVTGDMTLFAGWLTDKYLVTYNPLGGSAVGSSQVNSGGLISPVPGSSTKSGSTFVAWYKESGCYNVWNFSSDTVTGPVTLYAKWNLELVNVADTSVSETNTRGWGGSDIKDFQEQLKFDDHRGYDRIVTISVPAGATVYAGCSDVTVVSSSGTTVTLRITSDYYIIINVAYSGSTCPTYITSVTKK